jgi:hypothetical protein
VRGWGVGVRLVKGVRHTHAFDRLLRDAVDHHRRGNAGCLKDGRYDVDHVVELGADAAGILDAVRPTDRHTLPGAAEVRRHLLRPFERRVEGPRPGHRHVRVCGGRAPGVIGLQLLGDRQIQNTIIGGVLIGCADRRAFRTRAVVTADIDDQRVIELALVLDFLDHAADLVIGIGGIGGEHLRLSCEQLLLIGRQRVPLFQVVRPACDRRHRKGIEATNRGDRS